MDTEFSRFVEKFVRNNMVNFKICSYKNLDTQQTSVENDNRVLRMKAYASDSHGATNVD